MACRRPYKNGCSAAALLAIGWWSMSMSIASVASFVLLPTTTTTTHPATRMRTTSSSIVPFSTATETVCETVADVDSADDDHDSSSPSAWLDKGLLLSSFTDGLKSNPNAVDWLMNALVDSLWEEEQELTQNALKESNLASPCNGPDPVLLDRLEETDRIVAEAQLGKTSGGSNSDSDWKTSLRRLCETKRARTGNSNNNSNGNPIDLRVLYIPTAMYALRPGSTSTPGKQRGRNRADGKKRRTEILRLLAEQLEDFVATNGDEATASFAVRTVTMDFDDASVKQPEEVLVASGNDNDKTIASLTTGAEFPETGKAAIRDWKPHLVYVQGGNTFWLYHCMEKGDWTQDLIDACFADGNNDGASSSSSSSSFSAVYCGVSAGAILVGESMQTACWKEWDDPSVVPGKETYGDWTDVRGLDGAGRTSIFPHMTEEWEELAERKTAELLASCGNSDVDGKGDGNSNSNSDGSSSGNGDGASLLSSSVRCVRDDQAYVVDGRRRTLTELI